MLVEIHKKDWFTIPNLLGYFRLLLIPVFICTYMRAKTTGDYLLAAGIIGLSGFTDLFDGLIARKFNQITELGKLLDPVADKLTQCALAVCLASRFSLMWAMVALLVVKEGSMAVMGLALYKHNDRKLDGAMWFGKVSTAFLYVAVFALLLLPEVSPVTANLLIVTSCGLLLLSFVLYMSLYRKLWVLPRLEEK